MEAVTPEKSVATVDKLSKLFAEFSCAARIVGIPARRFHAIRFAKPDVGTTDQPIFTKTGQTLVAK